MFLVINLYASVFLDQAGARRVHFGGFVTRVASQRQHRKAAKVKAGQIDH